MDQEAKVEYDRYRSSDLVTMTLLIPGRDSFIWLIVYLQALKDDMN